MADKKNMTQAQFDRAQAKLGVEPLQSPNKTDYSNRRATWKERAKGVLDIMGSSQSEGLKWNPKTKKIEKTPD
jgi:hypothetical protein